MKRIGWRGIGLGLLLVGALGCVSYSMQRQAEIAEQLGDYDDAVLNYLKLVESDPGNITHRGALMRAKINASQAHFEKGKRFQEAGSLQRAMVELRQAVELDTTNQYALVEFEKVQEEILARERSAEVLTIDEMKRRARLKSQPPMLNPRSPDPISLQFPEQESVQDIYRALGKAFGINILFDPNLKDQQIAIELLDVTAQDALEILMRASGHFYKVLDPHTILIAADTPQNRRNYEDLVIQTFFLSNAETKDIVTMLRTLVDSKKVTANEQLNAIILRDTADRVKVAERLIQSNDKARAEVVVDVELMQLNTSRIRDLGMSLSNYSVTQTLDPGGDGVPIRLSDLEFINQNSWTVSIPSFIYDFMKSESEAQVLAKPQLRISDGEKASLHIGERVPIPTTTFNTGNTVGGNIIPVTSFQYTDIGIKIDIEPRVHHNLEVTLKLKVEVSNLAGTVAGSGGQEQPIIGTRVIETTIRLKDGETNFLAGLLRTDEASSEQGIPGLSDIPILGRLFTSNKRSHQRTDVILTLTPHISRKSDITEEDLLPIWVGTEQNITFRGGSPRVESEVDGPFEEESSSERIQEAIRNRLRNAPGTFDITGRNEQPEEEPEPPAGVDLVPTNPPGGTRDEGDKEDLSWIDEEAPQIRATLAANATRARPAAARVLIEALAPQTEIALGARFSVDVLVHAGLPVSHLPMAVRFDPSRLALDAWDRGGFLGSAGQSELLGKEQQPGVLLLGASRLAGFPGAVGSGRLFRLRFRALAEGPAEIALEDVRALGPGLVDRAVDVTSASVTITAGAPGPSGPKEPLPEGPDRAARRDLPEVL